MIKGIQFLIDAFLLAASIVWFVALLPAALFTYYIWPRERPIKGEEDEGRWLGGRWWDEP